MLLLLGALAGGFVLLARFATPDAARSGGPSDVSVIIPARNEEASIGRLLTSLAHQPEPAREVIVVDDGSTDATAAIARRAGATVVHAPPPPEGWIGKSWACHIGALQATGSVLVFVDADVTFGASGLSRVLGTWERTAREGLLSVQPFHVTQRAYEQLSAYPNLVAAMASGAFAPGRGRWSPVAFGPCLVTSAQAYRSVAGHEAVAGEVIEDIHLARVYGRSGRPVVALAGGTAVSFRMYPSGLRQLVDGWTKNLAGGPGLVSAVPLAGVLAWVLASIVVASDLVQAVAAWLSGRPLPWFPVAMWALVAAQTGWFLRRIGRFAWWSALVFPFLIAGFVAIFLRSVVRRTLRRRVTWHDRTISVRSR